MDRLTDDLNSHTTLLEPQVEEPMALGNQPIEGVRKPGFRNRLPGKKWWLVGLVGMVLIGIAVIALNVIAGPEELQTTTLTYWGRWEESAELENLFSEFEAANPGVSINYVEQSLTDYRERLQNALDSPQGPDLFRFHPTWVPMLSHRLGVLPEEIFSAAEYESRFYPVVSEWLKTSGGYVGLPLMYDGLGLYYNREVLSAAGMRPPETWDDLTTMAVQLTVKPDQRILRSGLALGSTENVEYWPDILGLLMLQNGASPARPASQAGVDAANYFLRFSQQYKIWDRTLPPSTYAFATEKVVMMLAPSSAAKEVKQTNPELDFGVAPVPQVPGREVAWANYWVEGVSANTGRNKQLLAWKLLAFLAEKESLRRLYEDRSENGLMGELFPRVDMADQLAGDLTAGAYILDAPLARAWYLSSNTNDNGLNDRIILYYEAALNSMERGVNGTEALMVAQEGIGQELNKYGLRPGR